MQAPRGILPEEAWIYEDAAFRPHPKQHQQYLRLEHGEDEGAEQVEAGAQVQADGGGREIQVDDDYPRPKFRTLDDVLHLQEDVEEGEYSQHRLCARSLI